MPSTARGARRSRALAAAGALGLACALTACSGGSGGSTPAAAATSAAPEATYTGSAVVDLSFWSWTLNSQAVVNEFNATHPNIHVDFTKITSGNAGYSKLFAAFQAGNGPDVFNCEYDMLPQFVSQGLVQDISAYVNPQLQSELGSALPLTTLGGKTWAIPFDVEPQLLWYRADLFKKYDLAVPTTWAQFQSEAQQLKKADPAETLLDVPSGDPLWIASLAEQAGADWFSTSGQSWKIDMTDPASEKVASYWQGLVDSGTVGAATGSSPAYKAAVSKGQILAMIEPAYEGAYISTGYKAEAGDWAAAPLPNWGASPTDGSEGGSSYALSKSAPNTAAALEFAEWMSTNSDAVATKLKGGTSSDLPADTQLASIAASDFTAGNTYYPNGDLFTVAASEAGVLNKSWAWGPQVQGITGAMGQPMGKVGSGGTIASVLSTGQSSALSLYSTAGLSASAG